jgi:hypothetical protein
MLDLLEEHLLELVHLLPNSLNLSDIYLLSRANITFAPSTPGAFSALPHSLHVVEASFATEPLLLDSTIPIY